ncbi:egg cell-secreted protein 1.1-like [Pyrus ussuriensis x Pyrus communis]|uniref:Egg cell-secreted protein 1.1-like n=1 Tax=Pyrus ussuriensis x Pyrus communis TaxID=2448454 RepID=A0A5N5FKW7_9ROSA|nr:egg cell-secreted protein 1.1-like [Pyrus ussuriensis x Pyrus communis]
MAAHTISFLFLLTALLALAMPFMASAARPLSRYSIGSSMNLASRLKLDEESANCWESLFQLQAWHGCCEAIRTIEHQCWPALLGTLGFTTEETDVLKGYCDEADHIESPPSTTPSPPSISKPQNNRTTQYS